LIPTEYRRLLHRRTPTGAIHPRRGQGFAFPSPDAPFIASADVHNSRERRARLRRRGPGARGAITCRSTRRAVQAARSAVARLRPVLAAPTSAPALGGVPPPRSNFSGVAASAPRSLRKRARSLGYTVLLDAAARSVPTSRSDLRPRCPQDTVVACFFRFFFFFSTKMFGYPHLVSAALGSRAATRWARQA
jgi:hypothetical protein